MNGILEMARKLEAQIIADRRHIHQNPEVGMDLPKTAAYVKRRLTEMGIEAKDCIVPLSEQMRQKFVAAGYPEMMQATGVVATIGSGSPCILLRADMDALPMEEQNDLDFRAEGMASHMCGHDSHVAMLLGAASILKELEGQIKGSVKLIFQPGEELGCGAKLMVDGGVLQNPKVDAAAAIHIISQIELGAVTCAPKVASSSMDSWLVKIQGKGGHSSQPQDCIDPLMIMNQIYTSVNLLVTREVSPQAVVTLTCGVAKGGTAVNIIPDTAELGIGMRTQDKQARDHLVKRVPEVIEHITKAWRGTCEITPFNTPSAVCDPAFLEKLRPSIEEIVGRGKLELTGPMAGSEDFGYFTEDIPAVFLLLGAGGPDRAPHHNPRMVLDESAFVCGAALYANMALNWTAD